MKSSILIRVFVHKDKQMVMWHWDKLLILFMLTFQVTPGEETNVVCAWDDLKIGGLGKDGFNVRDAVIGSIRSMA